MRAPRATARILVSIAAFLAGAGRVSGGPAREAVAIDGFATVQTVRIEDVDGDGVKDLLLLSGREARVWRGSKDGAIAVAPTWVFAIPATAAFVDVGRPYGEGDARVPTLFAVGGSQALRIAPAQPPGPSKPPAVEEGIAVDVAWSDAGRAVFCDLVRGKSLLLPTPNGWRWTPDWIGARSKTVEIPRPPRRKTTPAGPFLEDKAVVSESWPEPVLQPGAPPAAGDVVWMLCPDGVHASVPAPDGTVTDRSCSTEFLPTEGDWRRVLVDLDGDGLPDLVQESTTNQDGKYAFYRTPPATSKTPDPAAPPPSLKPARAFLHLTGFQLTPDYVDLDGDGRKDFVVTTIEIDQTNVSRAVVQKMVTAKTKAFLNRSKTDEASWFAASPDGEKTSDVGVTILFTYTGVIDVQRFFTILSTADLDGDGRKDLVIRTSKEALTVWPGAASGVWAADGRQVAIPPMGDVKDVEGFAGDLNGDGKDDLVLVYRAPPGGQDRTFVVVSP